MLLLAAVMTHPCVTSAAAAGRRSPEATVDELLQTALPPFAIGHRGFGDNLGEDTSRPLENTVSAVRAAFLAGVSVVEVDVQVTRDGEVAVLHDEILLPDFACASDLTLSALQARLPHVPSLQAVLNQVRRFNQESGPLRGLVIVELKAAAPLCDPDDTREEAIVSAVVSVIRRMAMMDQVMLASLSPQLLALAAREAPEIVRILTVSGLQFLTVEELDAEFHCGTENAVPGVCPVVPSPKDALGLQWGQLGILHRLPGYSSVEELLGSAVMTGVRVVEADLPLLLMGDGAAFVEFMHAQSLKVFGFTVGTEAEWLFFEALGVDGIYTNDVPLGILNQAPIP